MSRAGGHAAELRQAAIRTRAAAVRVALQASARGTALLVFGRNETHALAGALRFDLATGGAQAATPPPEPRYDAAAAAVGLVVCLFGGRATDPGAVPVVLNVVNTTLCYDFAVDAWAFRRPMLWGAARATAVAAPNGSVYVAGGYAGVGGAQDLFLRYDFGADAWAALPPLPAPRHGHGLALHAGVVYVAGGFGSALATWVDTLFRFSLATGEWLPAAAALPRPLTAAAFFVWSLDPALLCTAGGNHGNTVYTAAVQCYDPAADAWAPASAELPVALAFPGAVAAGAAVWIFGGRLASATYTAGVTRCDPLGGCTALPPPPLLQPQAFLAAAVVPRQP